MSEQQFITSKVDGLKELEDRLLALSKLGTDKDSFDSMNFAIRKALQPVKERAQQLAPYSGADDESEGHHLRDSIKIAVPRSHKKVAKVKGRAAYGFVGVSKKYRNVHKALAKEYGLNKSRKYAPSAFLRPALYRTQGEVIRTLKRELGRAIDRRVKRLSKGIK